MIFVLLGILILPMIEDLKNHQIRNLYFVIILLIRIIYLIIKKDLIALKSSLVGTGICIAILLVCYLISKEGIGLGDIKLLISIAFYLGNELFLSVLLYISLCSLLFSLFLLARKQVNKKTELPFVPFIFAGTLVATLIEVIF